MDDMTAPPPTIPRHPSLGEVPRRRKSEMQMQRQELQLLKESVRVLEEKRDKLRALIQERKLELNQV